MGIRVFIKLLDVVWGLISLIPAILAVGGFLASHYHPSKYIDLQWLGLFMPLILVVNIIFIVYWIGRKKLWFVIPLFAVLLNINYISGIIQWPFKQIEPAGRELNVATYNIQKAMGGDLSVVSHEIAGFMHNEKIDILCLQEFPDTGKVQLKNDSGNIRVPALL